MRHCVLGHKLVAPNLYANGQCRACARAKQYCFIHGMSNLPGRLKVEADIYYQLIMMGKGNKDRRFWSKSLRRKLYPAGYKETTS
jgi:hypothetical protein